MEPLEMHDPEDVAKVFDTRLLLAEEFKSNFGEQGVSPSFIEVDGKTYIESDVLLHLNASLNKQVQRESMFALLGLDGEGPTHRVGVYAKVMTMLDVLVRTARGIEINPALGDA